MIKKNLAAFLYNSSTTAHSTVQACYSYNELPDFILPTVSVHFSPAVALQDGVFSVCDVTFFTSVQNLYTTLQASVVKETLKFRHQQTVNDTLQRFDSWILLTMLGSRDMAKFVSQEAYDRASLPDAETSVHVINHMILQFVIEHVLFYQTIQFCPVSSVQASGLAFMQCLSWLW